MYYVRRYQRLLLSAGVPRTGSPLSGLSTLFVLWSKTRLLTLVFCEHGNNKTVCWAQWFIKFLWPLIQTPYLIASWSVVCCNELVSRLFFESESSPQKQVKGWPPCVELAVLMKNHRVMIKNFLATFPVTWVIFFLLSQQNRHLVREGEKNSCACQERHSSVRREELFSLGQLASQCWYKVSFVSLMFLDNTKS